MSKQSANKVPTLNIVLTEDSPDGLLPRQSNPSLWNHWQKQGYGINKGGQLTGVRLNIDSRINCTNEQVKALINEFLSDYVCPKVTVMQTSPDTLVVKDLMKTIANDFRCFMARKNHEVEIKINETKAVDPDQEIDEETLELLVEKDDEPEKDTSVQDTIEMSDTPTTETALENGNKKGKTHKTLAEMGHDTNVKTNNTKEAATDVLKKIIGGSSKRDK